MKREEKSAVLLYLGQETLVDLEFKMTLTPISRSLSHASLKLHSHLELLPFSSPILC